MYISDTSLLITISVILIVGSITAGCVASNEQTPFTITFFNVGEGDSCLFQINGKTMLVDAGPYEAGPVIADWLKARNITALDIVVVTHPHSDHIGGIPYLLKRYNTGVLIDTGDVHTTPSYEKLLRTIGSESIPYRTVRAGESIRLDPAVAITVLSPQETLGEEINDNSIVLRISAGNTGILLMGDAGREVENRIMSGNSDLKSDILKVGHHGSRHSSGKDFIQEVSPEVAVISLAADNEYGYPQKDPIRYLTDTGARILRTDQEGTITVRSTAGGYEVITGDDIKDMTNCSCPAITEFCSGSAGVNTPCCQACP